jgi:opacity protein-like surface antigen
MKQLVILSAVVLMLSASVAAHHSAVQFDFTKSSAVTGVVKKFIAINPHMQLVLHVKDAKGERDIEFEGHSTNNMYRAGYRDNMIKVGDTITVYVAPLKDGGDGGYVTAALTASGVRFGARSRAEQEQERLKAEGKK